MCVLSCILHHLKIILLDLLLLFYFLGKTIFPFFFFGALDIALLPQGNIVRRE